MNILIVEDDLTNQKLINVILSSSGHTISSCGRADAAFEKAYRDKPDLILMDLVLPDESGTSLATKLKSDDITSKIPIIAITGYPEKFRQREIVYSGFDAYIVKPINTRILIDMIEGLSPRKSKEVA